MNPGIEQHIGCDYQGGSNLKWLHKYNFEPDYNNYPYGPQSQTPCLRSLRTIKGTDQPAHQHRLISAFVIQIMECILSKFAKSEFSIFYQVSVADKTGLNLALSEAQKTGFAMLRPNE